MNSTLHDIVRPPVRVLFVGINPGIRSAAIGHHFAGFSNRFWRLLFDSGLVPERLRTEDDGRLPEWGYGITNLVPRATPGVDTLTPEDFAKGRRALIRKVRRWKPKIVALVGVTVFRQIFRPPSGERVACGRQPYRFEGAEVFVLPNPSGRNANYSYRQMRAAFRALARASSRR